MGETIVLGKPRQKLILGEMTRSIVPKDTRLKLVGKPTRRKATPEDYARVEEQRRITAASKRGIGAKILDVISAPLSQPIATLTKGFSAGGRAVARERLEIREGRSSGAGVILTTLGTTAAAAGGVLATTPTVVGGVIRGGAAKVLTSKTVVKAGATVAAVAAFAPETFKRFISSKGAVQVGIAAAVSPVAGVVVGLEKGVGLVSSAVKGFVADPTVKKALDVVVPAAAITAAGVAGVAVAKKLLPKKETLTQAASGVAGAIPKELKLPTSLPAATVGAGSIVAAGGTPVIKSATVEKVQPATTPKIKIVNKPSINIAIAR